MSKTTDIQPVKEAGDLVLREVWRAKDTLSDSYGHDLDMLIGETRKHEKLSGHLLAELPIKRREK